MKEVHVSRERPLRAFEDAVATHAKAPFSRLRPTGLLPEEIRSSTRLVVQSLMLPFLPGDVVVPLRGDVLPHSGRGGNGECCIRVGQRCHVRGVHYTPEKKWLLEFVEFEGIRFLASEFTDCITEAGHNFNEHKCERVPA